MNDFERCGKSCYKKEEEFECDCRCRKVRKFHEPKMKITNCAPCWIRCCECKRECGCKKCCC